MNQVAAAATTVKASQQAIEHYQAQMAHSILGGFSAASDLAACLLPLLKALGWKGDPRHVAESLPHFANELDLTGLRNVMAQLNYSSRPLRVALADIDKRLLPCLFLPDKQPALVVRAKDDSGVEVFDSASGETRHMENLSLKGTAFFFTAMGEAAPSRVGWFRTVLDRFRPLFWQAFFVTLFLNVMALATPIFVMNVYDKVIGTNSMPLLVALCAGVAFALTFDAILRAVRARILAFIGARLDNIMGNNIFQHILSLPPGFTERATIGAQVARIKDFESVREFFTGPLATVFMELPFAIFYFAIIFMLGGVLALVPVISTFLFLIGGFLVMPVVRKNVSIASRAASRRQEFLIETLGKLRAVKLSGVEHNWVKRYREMSARAAYGGFKNGIFTAMITTGSNILIVSSGLATIATGVLGVIDGVMTTGGLIAAMMLVWRVLGPLQTAFTLIQRVEQVRGSITQIDQLMNLKPERDPKAMVAPLKNLKGRVSFSRVSLRYSNDADPALVGVSFDIEPGEVVAVTGRNGSGKSTIIKLMMGLYAPQAGSIRIDNSDMRQIDPLELRHAIGYVPQVCNLFFGTIAQNLRLAQPTATESDIRWACELADVWDEIMGLPRGMETRVGDGTIDHLPTSFVQKLSLARCYLKRSPLMLFDEPVNGLDFEGDRQFMQAVEFFRGQSTIFMVTHRPSHLRFADKILVFDGGYLRLAGPADEVRARIPPDLI
ncbi:peptidase domain-containing ABC transporter [Magnetospirillum sulfuroxidans]|uniref:ATP-binding cassette domain-containing protein n=1 Tax=Magnetospirillum sulfuroxidans TaxID=611300 RepID=A0ABS5IA45_9PROT|nr:ABC transporter transmembrane domain-containing protein [Magnetospirillum sulfuroxidans]MBR9970613.1 ATP-binding cassette domain-containing protein [Magnetospirillum sulfuroxidans]